MNKKLISVGSLFALWLIFALLINKEVILPSPIIVGQKLIELIQTPTFYTSVLMTFTRAHIAFGLSLIIGITLAVICYKYEKVEEIISVWIKGLQTIPQISFIILLYFWLDASWCVFVVVILMAFPIVYFNYLEGLRSIPSEYTDIIKMTNHSWWELIKTVYLPLCYPNLMASIKSGLPLSLKVTVMSEVLIYTTTGIGKQLSLAKSSIDMVSVFAWTLAFIALTSLEMHVLTKVMNKQIAKQK